MERSFLCESSIVRAATDLDGRTHFRWGVASVCHDGHLRSVMRSTSGGRDRLVTIEVWQYARLKPNSGMHATIKKSA